MSHSLNTTLDLVPAVKNDTGWKHIINNIKAFFEAVDNGRNARAAYARLTAHGVSPSVASEKVFARYFGRK